MKTIQKTAGIVLVVLGVVLGFGVGIYFIDLGVKDLRKGLYLEGLLKCLVYAEFWGMIAAIVPLIPGVLLLRFLPGADAVPLPEPPPQSTES